MLSMKSRLPASVMSVGLASLLVTLTACNSQTPTSPTLSANAGPTVVVPTTQASSPVELRIFVTDQNVYAPLADAFMRKYPEVKIAFYQSYEYPHKQIPELIKSGTPVDLVDSYDSLTSYMVGSDLLMDLREFMAADPQFDPTVIQDTLLQTGQVGGKPNQYLLPVAVDNIVLFYNKSIFGKAGVPEPTEDWTWDDLVNACKKIQSALPGIVCLGPWKSSGVWNWYPWVRGYGGDVYTANGSKSTYSSPEVTEALRNYTELWTKHHIMQPPGQEAIDCFSEEKCAATVGNISYMDVLKKSASSSGMEVGTQLIPKFPKGRFTTSVVVEFGIVKGAQHSQQAWQFLKYMLSPEAQGQVIKAGMGLPVLKSSVAIPADDEVYVKALASAVRIPAYPSACGSLLMGGVSDAQTVTANAIDNAIKGYATLEEGLKRADTRLDFCLVERK